MFAQCHCQWQCAVLLYIVCGSGCGLWPVRRWPVRPSLWRPGSGQWSRRVEVAPGPRRRRPVSRVRSGLCGETEKGVCPVAVPITHAHAHHAPPPSLSTDYTLYSIEGSYGLYAHARHTARLPTLLQFSTLRAPPQSPNARRDSHTHFLPTICENVCTRRARSHPPTYPRTHTPKLVLFVIVILASAERKTQRSSSWCVVSAHGQRPKDNVC